MSEEGVAARINGIYPQDDQGRLMLRIKVPAGLLAVEQAEVVADLSERFAGGGVHLTVRGSIELHGLVVETLPEISRRLAAVGLTSRGACGGAVRGISCSTTLSEDYPKAHALARRLHRHFTGNPRFEGLPKKFKMAVEGGYGGSRHLIQDLAIVRVEGSEEGRALYDVWVAGGLGVEPQPAFLLEAQLPEDRLLPLIEGVLSLYRDHAAKGRRLKHLVKDWGEDKFRRCLAEVVAPEARLTLGDFYTPTTDATEVVTIPVFAGELAVATLRRLANLARRFSDGILLLTANQDLALRVDAGARNALYEALQAENLTAPDPAAPIFRLCPGSHACKKGLSPTRDIARQILAHLPTSSDGRIWALSGCPNACSQPQLADVGILTRRAVRTAEGRRSPRFDVLRLEGEAFGTPIARDLDIEGLLTLLAQL
ncbi:MAG: nitrite reductase [Desulfuromonas sp.]|nr:MAG: nitrite reductase [Desulfuromonas sp.]